MTRVLGWLEHFSQVPESSEVITVSSLSFLQPQVDFCALSVQLVRHLFSPGGHALGIIASRWTFNSLPPCSICHRQGSIYEKGIADVSLYHPSGYTHCCPTLVTTESHLYSYTVVAHPSGKPVMLSVLNSRKSPMTFPTSHHQIPDNNKSPLLFSVHFVKNNLCLMPSYSGKQDACCSCSPRIAR